MKVAACFGAAVALIGASAGVGPHGSAPAHAAAVEAPVLPQRLADTGLFNESGAIAAGIRLFSPQYPLWSDGMAKKRWVYLPPGSVIDARDEYEWNMPAGTRFWKEFSVGARKVETRMLWKTSDAQWIAASYIWNSDGTDAVLAPDAGVPDVIEVAPGRRHSIPSRSDCLACHGKRTRPLGFNALQLSADRDPNAIHGEPLGPGMISLTDLVNEDLLAPARPDLAANPPRIRTSLPATRSILGYLSSNCGTCHNGSDEISAAAPAITYRDLLTDGDAVASSLVGRPTRWQIPGTPDGATVLIQPGAPQLSALVARMRSRSPSSQMPPLGTVLRDEKALSAIELWIKRVSWGALESR